MTSAITKGAQVDFFYVNSFFFFAQIRFLHDPSKDTGFVGCALTSTMVRFFQTGSGTWSHEVKFKKKRKKQD